MNCFAFLSRLLVTSLLLASLALSFETRIAPNTGPRGATVPFTTYEAEATAHRTTGKVEVRQVRSGIGHERAMRDTLKAIGLKHHQDVVVKQDSPSLRGQLKHVRHLIEVTPVEE